MTRMAIVLVSMVALATSYQSASAEVTLSLNKKHEGELQEPHVRVGNIDDFRNSIGGFASEHYIQLKSKEPLTVTAEVVGDGRLVAVLIEDSAGSRVAFEYFKKDQVTAKVKTLSSTGKYKITVVSDKIGDYSIKAINPNAGANNGATQLLLEKIDRLKKELNAAQEELKSLEKSGSDK